MTKIFNFLLLFILLFEGLTMQAQCPTTVIGSTNATSGFFRGLNPNNGRGTTVFLVTAAEMAAAGFSFGNSITQVGGAFATAPSIATTGNLEIRFENTTDVINNKSTTWATAISTMTVAHNATTTIPNALSWNVTLGTPFTYTGGGIYISYEWTNCGTLATGSVVACNTTLAGVKSAQTAVCTAIVTVSANSLFRPVTTLVAFGASTNISLVSAWPHGKIPAGAGAPEAIPFTVRSTYGTAQTTNANLEIKEAITGTVRYYQTLPITIPSCGELTSEFTGWMPAIQETDSVIVTIDPVAGESNLLDNASRKTEIVGNNAYTHNLNGFSGARGAIGFNTGSGLLLAKHSANGCVSATAVKARLSVPLANVGNTVYGVIVSPTGAILGQSPNYVTSATDSNTVVTFTFPSPVALSNTDFYIGIAQTVGVTGYFPLMTESEALTRPNTYYSTALAGGGLSLPYTSLGRLDLQLDIATTPAIYASIENQNASYCPGSTFNVNYVATNTTINAGNIFNIELSDAAGSFAAPIVIGTLNSIDLNGSILATIPSNQPGSGIYKIRITASNTALTGCSNSTFLNILTPPTFSSVTPTNVSCNGGANGSVVVSSAAVLPSFSISPVSTQSPAGTFINLAANTYTVTVTDGNSCTATSTVDILQPNVLAPSIAATPLCVGGNATLTGSATGGTPSYTYQWISGVTTGTGSTFNVTTAGTYTLIATDANGCSATSVISVSVLPLPTIVASASPSSVCLGSSSTLSATGASTYTWNPGALVGAPSVTPTSTTIYTVEGTDVNGCSNTNTISLTVNTAPNPVVTEDSICAPGGVVNLAATGTVVTWYDALTGGTLLNTGTTYNPSVIGTTTYYVENSTSVTSAPVQAPMPAQTSPFSGNVRGYWFTAPTNFTITSLQVPTTASSGNQSIAVVKFNGNTPPPIFAATTNAFTTLYLTQNNATPGNITVNIPILAGEVIGILGVRGNVNSYSSTGNTTTINGFSVSLNRMGMQFQLATTSPQDIWSEASGSISRVNFEYTITTPGCTSTPRIPVTATVNALPTVTATPATQTVCQNASATVSGGGATSYVWSGGISDATPFPVTSGPTTYTVTGTDGNNCSNTATAVVNMNTLPTITATPTTQTVCENGQATVTGGGAGVGGTYTWSGLILDATPFTVTSSATYTVTGTDGNNCSNTATAVVTMNAAPLVTASATPTTTCDNSIVVPTGGGATSYVWNGGLFDGVPFVASFGTTSYTVTGTDGAGCTATSSVTVTGTPASGTLAPATANQVQNQGDDLNASYYDLSCNLIASIDDGNGGNILGLTTATVNVDANAGVYNGQPYVRRWYQITPTSNGSADVKLYITQADFDNYNLAVVSPYLPMPTSGNNADPNITNIRITKNSDGGLGNSPLVIQPSAFWNGTYWELSFNTPGFSQFRVHSVNGLNAALPATITNFSGRKMNNSDLLEWTTASEQNNAYFNLQHGTDGVNFTTIAKVNSKAANGNSSSILNYNVENTKPQLGHNYYRLQQVDIDNHSTMNAKVVDIIWGTNGSTVSIYPNPTQDVLNIDLYTTKVQNTTVKVLDMSGRIVKQVQARSEAGMNKLSLSLGDIASGVYTVQVFENDQLTHVSKVKKND